MTHHHSDAYKQNENNESMVVYNITSYDYSLISMQIIINIISDTVELS